MKLPYQLDTPVYVKLSDADPTPTDPVYYLLTQSGLFLCRNHEFFTSSTPAKRFPCELAEHQPQLLMRYPKIPRRLFELAVGYFTGVYQQHGSEAGLLMIWDRRRQRMRLECPKQLATVSRGKYGTYPIGLHYDIPELGEDDVLLGDLHSHGDESAYASAQDKFDEHDRAGTMHIVVGHCGNVLCRREPQVHVDVVVDGMRFTARKELVIEGYRKARMNVPREWFDRLTVKDWTWQNSGSTRGGGSSYGSGSQSGSSSYYTTYRSPDSSPNSEPLQ